MKIIITFHPDNTATIYWEENEKEKLHQTMHYLDAMRWMMKQDRPWHWSKNSDYEETASFIAD